MTVRAFGTFAVHPATHIPTARTMVVIFCLYCVQPVQQSMKGAAAKTAWKKRTCPRTSNVPTAQAVKTA
jgi:hypothetical protein